MHRSGAIRFPQFLHTLAHEHERHTPPVVLLDPVERAAHRRKERGKKKVIRDNGRRACRKLCIYAPLSGVWSRLSVELLRERPAAFFSGFHKAVKSYFSRLLVVIFYFKITTISGSVKGKIHVFLKQVIIFDT
jgi:hypothetical protein